MSLNFLNTVPIFKQGFLNLTISGESFSFIFDYFYGTLYSFSKKGQVYFSDFRVILISCIFMRLNSNNSVICGKLLNQTSSLGLPPGINTLVSLLPLNGKVSLAGFVILSFSLQKDLHELALGYANNGALFNSLTAFRQGCNYDRIIFETPKLFDVTTVLINSFFVNLKLDDFCMDRIEPGTIDDLNLCVPSAAPDMTMSLAATILFFINISPSDFSDISICLGSKYLNRVHRELHLGSLVNSAMVTVFGNNNVNFGRSDYSTVNPGNRVHRQKPFGKKDSGSANGSKSTDSNAVNFRNLLSGIPPEITNLLNFTLLMLVKTVRVTEAERKKLEAFVKHLFGSVSILY